MYTVLHVTIYCSYLIFSSYIILIGKLCFKWISKYVKLYLYILNNIKFDNSIRVTTQLNSFIAHLTRFSKFRDYKFMTPHPFIIFVPKFSIKSLLFTYSTISSLLMFSVQELWKNITILKAMTTRKRTHNSHTHLLIVVLT